MSVSWIEYKTKKILYIDYSKAKTVEDTLKILEEDMQIERESPPKLPTLVNYLNAPVSNEYMKKVKIFGKEFKAPRENKSAIIGVDGVKALLVKGYLLTTLDRNVKVFVNEYDAKEWLIK